MSKNVVISVFRSIIVLAFFLISQLDYGISNFNSGNSIEYSEKKGEVIVIHDSNRDKSEKEALLILPGFGDSNKGRKHQKKYFGDKDFDLYIPNFYDRKSFDGAVKNLTEFYFKQELDKYKKVHVFSYIMGSWVINTFIKEQGKKNIATIIYDRSPPQERAPKVMAEEYSPLGKLAIGQILVDLSKLEYPTIEKQGINIGIIVESKATRLLKIVKKAALSYGEMNWDAASFKQDHDDLMYTWLNHDQMYIDFDIIGEDILHFIRHGKFKEVAQRTPYTWDIFEKYKAKN